MTGLLRAGLAGAAFAVVTLALLPVQLVGLRLDHAVARRLPRFWHRLIAPVLGLRVNVHGTIETRRPVMLVANHASWLDIIALGSIADVVFIAKAEVRDWPVFGKLARWQRSVFVDREVRRSTGRQIAEVAERLDRGEVVVLFAEGTTSDGNRVLDFKSSLLGAARAAAEKSAHGEILLQPVAIAYTRIQGLPMGRRHRAVASWPGDVALGPHLLTVLKEGAIDVDIVFGTPVRFDAASDRKAVTRALQSDIQRLLSARLRAP
jgi:lyso-ornithine lipid O-acyltransferase